MAKRSSGSDLDRYMRDEAVHFNNLKMIETKEAIVEKLIEAMRDMDPQDAPGLADLARDWTFTFARQQGATIDFASELARSVANRVHGEFQTPRSNLTPLAGDDEPT